MKNVIFKRLAVLTLACSLTSCGKHELAYISQSGANGGSAGDVTLSQSWSTISSDLDADTHGVNENLDLRSVLGNRDIPYPVYPNGQHYRVGDENGLKIIVFQTEDSFEEVDAYYQSKAGLPRLSAMNDYVRYSTSDSDRDPWQTNNPGIVIHEFGSTSEKMAIGAENSSRTNIIMSFK